MIKKLILPTILACLVGLIIYFISPNNIFIITGFIFLITLTIFLFISIFFNKKIGLLLSFYVFFLLLINYLIGFDYLTIGLLTSLLIAVWLLIK